VTDDWYLVAALGVFWGALLATWSPWAVAGCAAALLIAHHLEGAA
jgi:hypothetical protein